MSTSTYLLSAIVKYRNDTQGKSFILFENPLKAGISQASNILMIPYSLIETAISSLANLFAILLPLSQNNKHAMHEWLKNSSGSVLWSTTNSIANFFLPEIPKSIDDALGYASLITFTALSSVYAKK